MSAPLCTMGRMFRFFAGLPEWVEYPDAPLLPSNRDCVEHRTIRAAWHALFTKDVTDLSFLQLSKDVGVSYTALYRYFPSVAALGATLVRTVFETLEHGLIDIDGYIRANTRTDQRALARSAVLRYVEFAARRPRHFGLALSGQFSGFAEVVEARARHLEKIRQIAELWVGRVPTDAELSGLRGVLFDSGRMGVQRLEADEVLARVGRCFGAEPASAARTAAFTAAMNAVAGGKSFTTGTSTIFGFIPVQTPTFACALNAAIDTRNPPSSETKNGTFHLMTSDPPDGTAE